MSTLLFILNLAASMGYTLTISVSPPGNDCQHIDAENHRIIVCAEDNKKSASIHVFPIIPWDQEAE